MSEERPSAATWAVRPRAFAGVLVGLVVVILGTGASVTDPSIAALVWTVIVALVVIGTVWPLLAMRLLRLTVVEAPTDAVVDTPSRFALDVSAHGLLDMVVLRVDGTADGEPWATAPMGRTVLDAASAFRGVFPALSITAMTQGPLGLMTVARRLVVPLPRPLHVGPALLAGSSETTADASGSTEATGRGLGAGDQIRSVRPYRTGDPAHLVHWPTSARVGSLVVREIEPPARPRVVVVVDLGPVGSPTTEEGERAVSEAAGRVAAALAAGGDVWLCTSEAGRPQSALVATMLHAQRRLAACGPGPVDAPGVSA